jgi:hypothetical protein
MHTSDLRGSDFQIVQQDQSIGHGLAFNSITLSDRLGFHAEHALDGLGAAALILAHITAFYDRYREQGADFFAYPDFFSFQDQLPITDYGMLDIFPKEKNVHLPGDPWDALSTIASRAITVLVVPDTSTPKPREPVVNRDRVILESLRRTVRTCYLYSPTGQTARGDTTICCTSDSVESWGKEVIARAPTEHSEHATKWIDGMWSEQFMEGKLTQSYQQIGLEDAIARIVNREAVTRS